MLNETGPSSGGPTPALSGEDWLHMYQQMARIRTFEEHVNDLYQHALMPALGMAQTTGRLVQRHTARGGAVAVTSAAAHIAAEVNVT